MIVRFLVGEKKREEQWSNQFGNKSCNELVRAINWHQFPGWELNLWQVLGSPMETQGYPPKKGQKAHSSLDIIYNPTVFTRYFFSCSNFSSNFRIFRLRLWMCLVSWAMVCGSLPSPQLHREELRGLQWYREGKNHQNNGLPVNTAAGLQTKLPGSPEKSRGQFIIWLIYYGNICSLTETLDHRTSLWANIIRDFSIQKSEY